ncbi:MAG: molybdopterin molybdotransferase MoeA, partial [Ignavibacteriaceae bacterium]|nr:molybdopterin molybdotransferase MoeA [Ignavibacteriaceae bacterium]
MISYREARELIEDEIGKLKRNIIEVSLEDSDGLTLAEDIYSDINMPGFNNSSMDGYAINYTDGNKSWKIKGEIPAGNFKEYPIDIDSAVRIMTGGKIPLDTNAVIPIEDVTEDGDVIILKENIKVNPDQYIRFKGNDLKTGVIALKKNSLLKAQNIALAAACGKTRLKVYSKLNAGIMVTGDELVEITEDPGEDKVRATNLYSLLAGAMEINVNPINLGIVKDDKDLLMRSITSALQSDIDILITSGGVSVGKYDLLKDIFKEAGVETIFWRVNVRPGKP